MVTFGGKVVIVTLGWPLYTISNQPIKLHWSEPPSGIVPPGNSMILNGISKFYWVLLCVEMGALFKVVLSQQDRDAWLLLRVKLKCARQKKLSIERR